MLGPHNSVLSPYWHPTLGILTLKYYVITLVSSPSILIPMCAFLAILFFNLFFLSNSVCSECFSGDKPIKLSWTAQCVIAALGTVFYYYCITHPAASLSLCAIVYVCFLIGFLRFPPYGTQFEYVLFMEIYCNNTLTSTIVCKNIKATKSLHICTFESFGWRYMFC